MSHDAHLAEIEKLRSERDALLAETGTLTKDRYAEQCRAEAAIARAEKYRELALATANDRDAALARAEKAERRIAHATSPESIAVALRTVLGDDWECQPEHAFCTDENVRDMCAAIAAALAERGEVES